MDFETKPVYGQRAAEVWKDITGNYPMLPTNVKDGDGAVLMNTGTRDLHVVGFFGFPDLVDQVLIFRSYFLAEQFYRGARKNPHIYVTHPLRLEGQEEQPIVKPEEVETVKPVVGRPRHLYEGSGDRNE